MTVLIMICCMVTVRRMMVLPGVRMVVPVQILFLLMLRFWEELEGYAFLYDYLNR
jgi:hypothetical protein